MLQHWSLHPIPDRNQAEVCESAACSYTRAVLKVQCVLTEDPGKWQWTWTRGSWWQCKAFLQGTLGKKKWTWTASSYNGFWICSTMHKCLVVKVKQWYQNGSVLGQKKLFSKILKSLHAPLFRICLGQIIGKQSSDALICNFIQISLSGWQISKFKHLKSHWNLLPDTTLASLCIVISLKSTLFRASWSLGFGLWTAFGFCLTFGLGFGLTFSLGFKPYLWPWLWLWEHLV